MMEGFVRSLPALSALGSAIVIAAGGAFSFVRWLDIRNRELLQQRWSEYSTLMSLVAGDAKIPVQMAALFQLIEFKEYSNITINALEATNHIQGNLPDRDGNPSAWTVHIAPQVEKAISMLKAKT